MLRLALLSYLKDLEALSALPVSKKYRTLVLPEYPFDFQLLSHSRLYRESRQFYLGLGGTFKASVCSTMRSLSAQDLFKDEIAYTPSLSEFLWFKDHAHEVVDPDVEIQALSRFNEISLFHEQNHRVIWRLLPTAPREEGALCRYLNFAESLVVTLDLALGDELGKKNSNIFERMKVIYRPGGQDLWFKKSKSDYRRYLLALFCSTYFLLGHMHSDDILKALDYVLPGQKKINHDAVERGLELSLLFTAVTNPQWQERYWKSAQIKLQKIHKKSVEETLHLPKDPLDLDTELEIVERVLHYFGL